SAARLCLGLGRVGTGLVLTALSVTAYSTAELVPDAIALWWTRRHGLSGESYGAFLAGELGTLAFTAAAAWAVVALFLWLAARLGRRWWIPGAAAATAATVLFTLAVGALVSGRSPRQLVAVERALAAREHVSPPRPV